MAIVEVPEDCKIVSVDTIFRKGKKEELGNDRLLRFTSVPGKLMEQMVPETISKYLNGKKVTGSRQHGFMKGKLY